MRSLRNPSPHTKTPNPRAFINPKQIEIIYRSLRQPIPQHFLYVVLIVVELTVPLAGYEYFGAQAVAGAYAKAKKLQQLILLVPGVG